MTPVQIVQNNSASFNHTLFLDVVSDYLSYHVLNIQAMRNITVGKVLNSE